MGRPRKPWIEKSTTIMINIPNKILLELEKKGERAQVGILKLLKEKYKNVLDKD